VKGYHEVVIDKTFKLYYMVCVACFGKNRLIENLMSNFYLAIL